MTRPGDRLRALASRVFDAETMARLIDPTVADLQTEYAEALRAGLIWRRRWVRLVGSAALVWVATRTLRVFLALTFVLTVLFELPAPRTAHLTIAWAVYLVPQALVIAVPVALILSIAWASRPARPSRQSLTVIVASGVVCSAISFVTLAWWTPSANQAFRVSAARELGGPSSPPRGLPEMTIGELRQQMRSATTVRADWRELEFTYYLRWAFPCASLSVALLMGALRQRGVKRRALLVAAVPIVFAYYALMFVSRGYALGNALPPLAGAWMPNAIVALAAMTISTLGTRRQVVA